MYSWLKTFAILFMVFFCGWRFLSAGINCYKKGVVEGHNEHGKYKYDVNEKPIGFFIQIFSLFFAGSIAMIVFFILIIGILKHLL